MKSCMAAAQHVPRQRRRQTQLAQRHGDVQVQIGDARGHRPSCGRPARASSGRAASSACRGSLRSSSPTSPRHRAPPSQRRRRGARARSTRTATARIPLVVERPVHRAPPPPVHGDPRAMASAARSDRTSAATRARPRSIAAGSVRDHRRSAMRVQERDADRKALALVRVERGAAARSVGDASARAARARCRARRASPSRATARRAGSPASAVAQCLGAGLQLRSVGGRKLGVDALVRTANGALGVEHLIEGQQIAGVRRVVSTEDALERASGRSAAPRDPRLVSSSWLGRLTFQMLPQIEVAAGHGFPFWEKT